MAVCASTDVDMDSPLLLDLCSKNEKMLHDLEGGGFRVSTSPIICIKPIHFKRSE